MSPTSTYTPVPSDGSLDIVQVFQLQASQNPNHPLFRYDSESALEGYDEITWSRAVKMFETTAQILRRRLADNGDNTHVVGILAATSSVVYASLLLGSIRAGYTVFPLSTRNSAVATAHLIAESNIRSLLVSQDPHIQNIAGAATALLKARDIHIDMIPIPTYDEVIAVNSDVNMLPPLEHIDDERVIVIAHSSGSTSFPKVIPLTQGYFQRGAAGPDLSGEVLSAHASAMFHAAGLIVLFTAMYKGIILASFEPTVNAALPTPERVLRSALATKCTILACSPMFLEHWVKRPTDIDKLRTFSSVISITGPLTQVVGDMLEQNGVKLRVSYASTETSIISEAKERNGGWQYFQFPTTISPVLVPIDGNTSSSLFRLIIKDCATHRVAVSNIEIDGVPAFDTNDIVQQHPTNPNLYRVYGRIDDQIMHSNGEKTNPCPLEQIIARNPLVKSAVLFGRSKPHVGILIQPFERVVNLELFRESIWHSIEEANKFAPAHSRVFKNMMILSNDSKPIQMTPKGTLRRRDTLEDYAQEIEAAYTDFDKEPSSRYTVGFLREISAEATLEIVRGHVHANIRSDISDDEDIFEAGGDSLLAARIRNGIMQSLRAPALKIPRGVVESLPQDLVFSSPSITNLSTSIYELIIRDPYEKLKDSPYTAVSVSILEQQNSTIVRLCEPASGEPPLILVHGGSGDAYCFRFMQAAFKTGLWAIHVTNETPRTSFIAQTDFYYQKIKEAQPQGPYRIGGYSAGTFMACRLVILLQENGDEVIQVALLDSSPFLHLFPHPGVDQSTNFNDPNALREFYDRSVRNYCKAAMTWSHPWWHQFSKVIWERWNGCLRDEDMSELMRNAYHNIFGGIPRAFEFILGLVSGDPKGYAELTAALVEWTKRVRAPITLYRASQDPALANTTPEFRERWSAFGMDWGCKNVRVVGIDGDHGSILHSEQLFNALQKIDGKEVVV
ncbi:hypothetical protein C8R46DRAFT_1017532 [Mycena filopes]|nr:hypothetical protein C8R46DRAFT_1017532 [Mycena filopes]